MMQSCNTLSEGGHVSHRPLPSPHAPAPCSSAALAATSCFLEAIYRHSRNSRYFRYTRSRYTPNPFLPSHPHSLHLDTPGTPLLSLPLHPKPVTSVTHLTPVTLTPSPASAPPRTPYTRTRARRRSPAPWRRAPPACGGRVIGRCADGPVGFSLRFAGA